MLRIFPVMREDLLKYVFAAVATDRGALRARACYAQQDTDTGGRIPLMKPRTLGPSQGGKRLSRQSVRVLLWIVRHEKENIKDFDAHRRETRTTTLTNFR